MDIKENNFNIGSQNSEKIVNVYGVQEYALNLAKSMIKEILK